MTTEQQPKGSALPAALTPAQKAAATRRANQAARDRLTRAEAQRLAQVVNLHIAGMSLAEIGAAIGATAEEVDRILANDAQRYIRSQPQLRVYVRNWVSERYAKLLDAVWDDAVDKSGGSNRKVNQGGFDLKLASQDRAIKILDRMAKLHGADAPVQQEVKIEAAPEQVEALVAALAAQQGQGYDPTVFDGAIYEAELVEDEENAEDTEDTAQ